MTMTPADREIEPVPVLYREPERASRIGLIASSFAYLLGRRLVDTVPSDGDVTAALWTSEAAIVAHGTQEDPLFFFGNLAALRAFECDVGRFVGMPSRLSAEAPDRAEREALLSRVAVDGFIADYAGTRITATGRHFRIEGATVWNLIDDQGIHHGQAATFRV
ncbi:MAG TPA: MEKHLA domain-containing protein [Novosphingobium sp.]|nr:MEKHLA domain-containing protein [Novosphingobium sp.]